LINHTIDDTLGDELTGFKVQYTRSVWNNVQQCSGCAIKPNTSLSMNGTWTGVTYDSSLRNVTAELAFHGSAIYIYLIASNYPENTGLVSDVLCNFRMDGEIVGNYNHPTDGSYNFDYDVAAYSNASLKDDDHTFLIETTGTQQSYVVFDYALYTYLSRPHLHLFSSDSSIQDQSGFACEFDYLRLHHSFTQLRLLLFINFFLHRSFIFGSDIIQKIS
ncbi:hypothetical protein F5146DRAFT_938262, partial [Armillaria mellea]